MTTVLLIRHAAADQMNTILYGWNKGVHLNDEGRMQAEGLAEKLLPTTISAIYSSPLERAVETAGIIAARFGLNVEMCEATGEVRFGDWTGQTLKQLDGNLKWQRFNILRSLTNPPGGELMLEVQARMVRFINQLQKLHPNSTVCVVSHGDVIRSTLAHFAGIPLDFINRLEISPASISTITISEHGPRILRVNDTVD